MGHLVEQMVNHCSCRTTRRNPERDVRILRVILDNRLLRL